MTVDVRSADKALPTAADIHRDIADLKKAETENMRYARGLKLDDDLRSLWLAHAMSHVDGKIVDELISLLDSDDDVVRKYAAGGLTCFGTRARRATPALKKALDRITQENLDSPNVVQAGQDSTIVVMNALKAVQGLPMRQPDPHAQ
jgi:hypothetical protein